MDPQLLGPEQWSEVNRALGTLVLFAFLAINAAVSFLVAHAVLPSLTLTGDLPEGTQGFRRILYPISALSLLAAVYALARALSVAIALMQHVFPRFTF